MKKTRIGILSPSEIAMRRFLPALPTNVEFVGIAVASRDEWAGDVDDGTFHQLHEKEMEKANAIISLYGGRVFLSYSSLITSGELDAIYVPLPPALHFQWGKKALENGLHVLLEKPLTVRYEETEELIAIAGARNLLIYENYAFEFHQQIEMVEAILRSGKLGEVRQIRTSFGFPYRGPNDFRYNKFLGGGALNDCGGYPIKLATILLGDDVSLKYANLGYLDSHDVDVFGSLVLENSLGTPAIASFGMDNAYKCELEIWGSKNTLYCPRIFTPPADFRPKVIISGETNEEILVDSDDYFKNSISRFIEFLSKDKEMIYQEILLQDRLMEEVRLNHGRQEKN